MTLNEEARKFLDSLPLEEHFIVMVGLLRFISCKERNKSTEEAVDSMLMFYVDALKSDKDKIVKTVKNTLKAIRLMIEGEDKNRLQA